MIFPLINFSFKLHQYRQVLLIGKVLFYLDALLHIESLSWIDIPHFSLPAKLLADLIHHMLFGRLI